ncbi:MAG: hypothetical protein Q4P72_00005, partial [Eubacteriales bacterium]|nr:hypothetical protein [Eubacteriales bacterium]
MNYPKEFIDDMQKLWTRYGSREEAEAFFAALDAPRCRRSLRFNLQKLRRAGVVDDRPESLKNYLEDFCQRYQIPFQRVLWTQAGLYYPDTLRASQCIEYLQGLFYIQEASAMLPAELLDAAPGSRMIDLCAAPGGKTLRMAEALEEGGWLFSNDYSRSRAKVLRYNVRHFGLQRVAVYSASPEAFAQEKPASLDAVLIDEPCSGEGMIRRKPSSRLAR